MGKYDDLLVKMALDPNIKDLLPGRSHVFVYGQEFHDLAPIYMELYTFIGNHLQFQGIPKGKNKIITYKRSDGFADGHVGGPYPKWNRDADEMFFFFGTDPGNMMDLGATVEFHLGEGEDEETFVFDSPKCVFVPKNVRYGPIYVYNHHRNLIEFCVLTSPTRVACQTCSDLEYSADVAHIHELGLDEVLAGYDKVGSDVKGMVQE
jgi:hypothetical protein